MPLHRAGTPGYLRRNGARLPPARVPFLSRGI